MSLARDYYLMAKNTPAVPIVTNKEPRITYEGETTFWKMCACCGEMMPHIRKEDYSECIVCGMRKYAIQPTKSNSLGGG